VHRDIKPGNILLDKSGKPFVADFGLALREQDVGKGSRFAGTPAYMSPEQARGEGHRVDGRSDIFSLGIVFYELLTGKRPFKGESTAELLVQVTTFEPRPPRQLEDTIPKELERICLKALAKRASERYTTAKDMADDLRHWISTADGVKGQNQTEPKSIELEPATPGVGKDVFLSYASPDKEAAFRLCRLLEEKGISCWIAPRDVTPGADYGAEIVRAIEGTGTTILFLSAHANASIHVTHEVERATSKRKRVIPICLEDVKPGPSLELHLATAHRLDAFRLSPEQVATQLVIALRGEHTTPTQAITPPVSDQAIKIVPKGLRSFDAGDADFFLELLPGPRDREGLPDSIRFWKTRIEQMDADNTFSVGLIYGPSGCGKSSLMKAGLLPRLAKHVIAVYVEATGEDTEPRLLKGLRKNCPGLAANLGLKETLAALRRGQGIPAGKKVLIVLDQFEQWLHAKNDEGNTELVQALRQCDGGRVQCIVMVRDDFWMAATRFMRELEVRLLEGQNSAAVDLFPIRHAEKVLAAFGRAFGVLSESAVDTSHEQKQFLEQAVVGLAQEGKVVCVRLALFAEMMKGKSWTPSILKEVGGTEGVGVTFLEETFSAATAPPEHRYHQKAARGVLKALLPESGTDIKGHMRSHAELLEASGYGNRPKDFDDLIRILDSEIRLITPTDLEGKDGDSSTQVQAGAKYYQLTHDYLVPSLRDWLTRKQKETRRGRAELLLADRAAVWNARQENRQLPSLWQWASIRWLTQKKTWTPPQKKMMRKATRYHAVRGFIAGVLLAVVAATGVTINEWMEQQKRAMEQQKQADNASALVGRVFDADITQVPEIIRQMQEHRVWTDPQLKDAFAKAQDSKDARKQLHASLALLPVDAGQVDYLYGRMLKGEPQEVVVIRKELFDHRADLTQKLWTLLENPKNDQAKRFRAACALASFASDDARWEKVSGDVAATLVIQKPFVIAQWADALKDADKWLIPPLADFLVDEKRSVLERGLIASIYGTYAANLPDAYARLEKQLDEKPAPDASMEAKIALAKKQASIGMALMVMAKSEKVWPLLKHQIDPTMRTYLIERLGPGGVDPEILLVRLEEEKEVSVKRAILLSLGEFGVDRLSLAERRNHLRPLLQLYQEDPDPGIHGAAEWLLRKWDKSDEMKAIDKGLETGKAEGKRQWYINRHGQIMEVVPGPVEFWMGGNDAFDAEKHRRKIGRSFAIASKLVTRKQFRAVLDRDPSQERNSPTPDCPATSISWYDAAEYCNKLSEKEGIDKNQWCYTPAAGGRYEKGMEMAPNYLQRTGYRLPTEAEWEFSCRAGSQTAFSFGEAEEILVKYGWYFQNASDKTHPVGTLKPNDLGLFDMHGNVWQWCQNVYQPYPKGDSSKVHDDKEDDVGAFNDNSRVLRGGSFYYLASTVRSAYRDSDVPTNRNLNNGFRVARTLPLIPFTALQLSPEGGGK
jgi:formylglycine-generating enzyme required for sulfatase activity